MAAAAGAGAALRRNRTNVGAKCGALRGGLCSALFAAGSRSSTVAAGASLDRMCGIYGILQLDGTSASMDSLQPMARVTVHRGPDDEGAHVDTALAFGMRRLSIIDLAGGHQPLSNEDGSLWLVANAEIYN